MSAYYDSAEDVHISRDRAIVECQKHGACLADFFADLGDHPTYDAQAVLRWLGY